MSKMIFLFLCVISFLKLMTVHLVVDYFLRDSASTNVSAVNISVDRLFQVPSYPSIIPSIHPSILVHIFICALEELLKDLLCSFLIRLLPVSISYLFQYPISLNFLSVSISYLFQSPRTAECALMRTMR